jgi:Xaa-Pro aminopeptidase
MNAAQALMASTAPKERRDTMQQRSSAVQDRIGERVAHAMNDHGLAALVAASPPNIVFSTGSNIHTQKTMPRRLALSVFVPDAPPTFIVCNVESLFVAGTSPIEDVRAYVEFTQEPVDALAEVLRERGVESERIGLETHYLSWAAITRLSQALPRAQWIDGADAWSGIRRIKEPDEVDRLSTAAAGTVAAMESVVAVAEPDWTERRLSAALAGAILEAGADEIPFSSLSAGTNTRITHHIPGERRLGDGGLVRFDFGGLWDGYYSDVARMVAVGQLSARRRDRYRRLVEVHRAVIDACRPGKRCSELYELCASEFDRQGLLFLMPHIGHGMGVELHEEPNLSPQSEIELEPNMIINVEPITLDHEDGAGYHVEDLVLVTEDEPKVLTGSLPTEMQRLGG